MLKNPRIISLNIKKLLILCMSKITSLFFVIEQIKNKQNKIK